MMSASPDHVSRAPDAASHDVASERTANACGVWPCGMTVDEIMDAERRVAWWVAVAPTALALWCVFVLAALAMWAVS